jgi:glycerophosphoryl diester phosphodiesterase
MLNNIIEIAHRGNSELHKDNTIDSFISALDNDFDMIELDIQLCKSGEIIVYHDTYINDKMIIDMDFKDLLQLEPDIITLEEFFNIPGMKDTYVYLDLKGNLEIADELVEFIEDKELNKDKIVIASFNLKHLEILFALNNELQLGFITANNLSDSLYCKLGQLDYIDFVCINWAMLDHESIELINLLGMKLYAYTCSNKTILKHMLEYNIDGIVTNFKINSEED